MHWLCEKRIPYSTDVRKAVYSKPQNNYTAIKTCLINYVYIPVFKAGDPAVHTLSVPTNITFLLYAHIILDNVTVSERREDLR